MSKAFIFIHGWSSHQHKIDCTKDLIIKSGYDFVSFDLPLHGEFKSTAYDKELTFDDLSQYAIDHINSLNYDEVILMGHSMGGAIILLNYQHIKLNIKKIILLDPLNQHTGINNKEQMLQALQQTIKGEAPRLSNLIAGRGMVNALNLASLVKSFNEPSFTSRFINLKLDDSIKWYLMYGVNDLIIDGAATAMWLKTINKDISIYPIDNARHNPFSDNEIESKKILEEIIND